MRGLFGGLLLVLVAGLFFFPVGCSKSRSDDKEIKVDIGGVAELRDQKQTEIEEWTQS
jgi:hypothetical protein